MNNTNLSNEQNDLFSSSHLMVLITFTVSTILLIGESILLGWEKFILPLIVLAVIVCWIIHFRKDGTAVFRMRIYALLMMCTAFFYGIHPTSTYDLAIVMAVLIVLFSTTGMKGLITLCQVTYYLTMAYNISVMIYNGESFDDLAVTRIALHLVLIFVMGLFARIIIERFIRIFYQYINRL